LAIASIELSGGSWMQLTGGGSLGGTAPSIRKERSRGADHRRDQYVASASGMIGPISERRAPSPSGDPAMPQLITRTAHRVHPHR